MNYFIYTSRHFTPHRRYELNKLTSLPMCGFIAQLVEQRTGIAEVTGSNTVEALIFFRLLLSNCLNWKINCDDHSSHLNRLMELASFCSFLSTFLIFFTGRLCIVLGCCLPCLREFSTYRRCSKCTFISY